MAVGDKLPDIPQTIMGVPSAGTFANRPTKAHHGHCYYAEDLGQMMVLDAESKSWYMADGGYFHDSTAKILSDGFRGAALNSGYNVAHGTDITPAADPAIGTLNGQNVLTITTGDAGSGVAADGSSLTHSLIWECDEATRFTVFDAVLAVSAATTVELFAGFTDVLAATTLEMPFDFSDGTTIASTATDACGFLYDTTADTDTIRCVGTKAGTDATAVDTSQVPVANTFKRFTIKLDTSGNAEMFLDGTSVAVVANAISAGVDISPIIIGNATTTAGRIIYGRRLAVHQDWL